MKIRCFIIQDAHQQDKSCSSPHEVHRLLLAVVLLGIRRQSCKMGPQHSEVPAEPEDQILENITNKEAVEIYVKKKTNKGCLE